MGPLTFLAAVLRAFDQKTRRLSNADIRMRGEQHRQTDHAQQLNSLTLEGLYHSRDSDRLGNIRFGTEQLNSLEFHSLYLSAPSGRAPIKSIFRTINVRGSSLQIEAVLTRTFTQLFFVGLYIQTR